MNKQVLASEGLYPKILVRHEVINMTATSIEQEFTIEAIFDKMTTYAVFYTIDDGPYLFALPIYFVSAEPPIFIERINHVGIQGVYINHVIDTNDNINYPPQTFNVFALDFSDTPTTHTIDLYILLYGDTLE